MIEVWINGEKKAVDAGQSVAQLLDVLGVPNEIVIVEKNARIVHRNRYDEELVEPGDKLELVRLMGGG